ncbi:hypothetical protein MMSR116_29395 [Methylobacterium mesophilicum SR1.6/6]|uniref:Uncharacterized protein n=1 Tax=Methylobacterium mesophilicum SR1.6/6 TaxID=908290 RepID=A0A6B9FU49_9HYPH|nr:hypothetical protein [Methylobacterium mesophilicum]QGY05552.1 hypothetical protein MMSR116_29395 [Methylobacterium mesophilicum SR1.6/6]
MSDRAFLGVLAHLDPRAPGETMLVTVALPRGECDAVVKALGAPDPELGPHVALLPCLRPDHPRSDDDAVLLAALRTVNRLLAAGPPRLSHELLDELGALQAATAGRIRRRLDCTAPPSPVELRSDR